MTIQEEKKKAIADIESDQEKLLAEIISISKKLEKKNVKAAMASAIDMVTLGMQIRMLEAQKHVIMSQPMPKYPLGTAGGLATVPDHETYEPVQPDLRQIAKVFDLRIAVEEKDGVPLPIGQTIFPTPSL